MITTLSALNEALNSRPKMELILKLNGEEVVSGEGFVREWSIDMDRRFDRIDITDHFGPAFQSYPHIQTNFTIKGSIVEMLPAKLTPYVPEPSPKPEPVLVRDIEEEVVNVWREGDDLPSWSDFGEAVVILENGKEIEGEISIDDNYDNAVATFESDNRVTYSFFDEIERWRLK